MFHRQDRRQCLSAAPCSRLAPRRLRPKKPGGPDGDEVSAVGGVMRDSASEADKLAERQPGVPVNDAEEEKPVAAPPRAPSISGGAPEEIYITPILFMRRR
ncbi:hypothetical protein MRX96_019279 [Rhipicephalus microplus]